LLLVRLGWKKSLVYYLLVGSFCALLFLPLVDMEIIYGFRESIGYYFKKFEFNASIYYLVREWGFWKYGYNIIQTVGIKLAIYCAVVILLYAIWDFIQSAYRQGRNSKFKIQNQKLLAFNVQLPTSQTSLLNAYLFTLCIYFAFTTTVHPWYTTTLLALSIFTKFRFPLIWTGLIFLTYAGYSANGFSESLWLTALEYGIVISYFGFECLRNTKPLRTLKT
jgi:alpha-1,6-mannosyltransferase